MGVQSSLSHQQRRQSVLTGSDHRDSRMAADRMATGLPTVLCPASPLPSALTHFGENLCISKGSREKTLRTRDAVSAAVWAVVPLAWRGLLHSSAQVPESCPAPLPSTPALPSELCCCPAPTLLPCSFPALKIRTYSCEVPFACS